VVAVKDVLVWPAATVTVAGTETAVPVLLTATTKPPDGAGPVIVTEPVLELPPITDVGVNVSASTVGRLTVSVPDFVIPFADAEIVAVTLVETATVAADAVADVAPSETVMVAGTVTAALLEARVTVKPPAGAGPAKETDTDDDDPPITETGFTVTESIALLSTVTCADFDVPFADAVIVTCLSATTADVVTSKVADVAFRGTVTVAGTPAAIASEESDTVKPPSGAGPVKVMVPVAVPPPIRLDGDNARVVTPLRIIVNEPDLLYPFAVAVTVTFASATTAVVATTNVADV